MLKELIKEAPSVEEAKALIATEFGVDIEKIEFEIVQESQKKTLGIFGGNPAIVKGSYKISPAGIAVDYLSEILSKFGMKNPEINVVSEDEDGCFITIKGDDIGIIIGRRGDTLDALQYLAGLVINRKQSNYYRVMIDANGYREKREETLKTLAAKIAKESAKTGRRTALEPMNPYERRIIHTAVQEIKGATSWSVGTAGGRHVMIGPSDDNPVKNRPKQSGNSRNSGRDRNRDRGGKRSDRGEPVKKPRSYSEEGSIYDENVQDRPVRKFVPRQNPLPAADGATLPSKTKSEKEDKFSLYGRIDI